MSHLSNVIGWFRDSNTPRPKRKSSKRSRPPSHRVTHYLGGEPLEHRTLLSGNGLNVVLDPGHGIGNTAGGTAGIESRVPERDLTLDMARRVQTQLQNWGFTVTLTRNDEYEVSFENRSRTAQVVGADFFLSLHFNGLLAPYRGTEAFVKKSGNVNLADDVKFADIVKAATLSSFSQPVDRGTKKADKPFGVLDDVAFGNTASHHPVISALLEIESISSNYDVDRFFNNTDLATRERNRNKVATNIAVGIWQAKHEIFDTRTITAPSSLTATAKSATEVELAWPDVANEAGYRVFDQNGSLIASLSANTTRYTARGLSGGQNYWFKVEAYNSTSSAATDWKWIATPLPSVTTPAWISATATASSQALLKWTDAKNESGYRVYQGGALIATLAANSTRLTVGGLSGPGTYWFQIEAYNSTSAARTDWRSTVVREAAVTTPANFAGTAVSPSQVKLTWSDVGPATGFRVYNQAGSVIATLAPHSTSYTVSGLSAGNNYRFRLEAFNASSTARTSSVSVTMPYPAVDAPSWLSVAADADSRVRIFWADASNETSYQVYHWDGGRVSLLATVRANEQFYRTRALSKNQYHGFMIEAINPNGSAKTSWQWAWVS